MQFAIYTMYDFSLVLILWPPIIKLSCVCLFVCLLQSYHFSKVWSPDLNKNVQCSACAGSENKYFEPFTEA